MEDDYKRTTAHSPSYFLERTKRRMKHAAGSVEPLYRRVRLDAKIADKGTKSRSEKSRSKWRIDPKRDEKIFSYINAKLRKRQPIRLTAKSGHTVWLSRKTLAEAGRAGVRVIPQIGLPHWDHSSSLLKMMGWALASSEVRAVPFSLRVASNVIDAAKADKRGAGRHLQDRISRHLRYRFPGSSPTFWFAIEQGMWDELHLHGAVVIPDADRDGVKAALKAAGGDWKSATRQLQFSSTGNLVKWVGYSTKWLFGSMAKFGDERLIGASQTIRREAKRQYQKARQAGTVMYP